MLNLTEQEYRVFENCVFKAISSNNLSKVSVDINFQAGIVTTVDVSDFYEDSTQKTVIISYNLIVTLAWEDLPSKEIQDKIDEDIRNCIPERHSDDKKIVVEIIHKKK